MNIPKGFKPEKDLGEETWKKKRIRSISDLILKDKVPFEFSLFTKSADIDAISSYESMLPTAELRSQIRLLYKSSYAREEQPYFRIDILEYSNAAHVSERLGKFFSISRKLNSRMTFSTKNDVLVKGKYVVFLRGFEQEVLDKFVQVYKTRFGMKEIEVKYALK